jgi:hypothetical protein
MKTEQFLYMPLRNKRTDQIYSQNIPCLLIDEPENPKVPIKQYFSYFSPILVDPDYYSTTWCRYVILYIRQINFSWQAVKKYKFNFINPQVTKTTSSIATEVSLNWNAWGL